MPYSLKKKTVLEKEDVEDMIEKAYYVFADQEQKALEASSLVAFLFQSGCRISEALNVRKEDVKLDNYYLNITITALKQKKKNVTRVLPFKLYGDKQKNFFNHLIIQQQKSVALGQRLWAMCRWTAWNRIVTLNKRSFPHLFRHSLASRLANRGAGDDQLKKWFGWAADSDMTAQYVKYSSIQMRPISKLINEEEE